MSLESLMTHVITLERKSVSIDTSSGPVPTWITVTNFINVPATIQPLTAKDRISFAQRNIFITHRIYSYINLNPQPSDRIYSLTTGKRYVIIGMFDQAGRDRVFAIDVREQTTQT